jgi:hypothetical protein
MITSITTFLQETKVQIISILVASVYIAALLVMAYKKETFSEEIVRLEEPSSISQALANNVEVGLHINSFPRFSVKDSKFTFDGIVWFKFDKGVESFETLETFTFKNMVIDNNEEPFYKSKPIIKIIHDKVLVSYQVQATFMAQIAFKRFPIGGHRINLLIENRNATTQELLFSIQPENVTFNNELLVDNWQPIAVHTDAGIVGAKIGGEKNATNITYPSVNISMDFKNHGARGLISLYFPLFILFFIGLLSLTIGIFDPARLGIIASSLPTLVLFRLVIDAVSPEVGYTTQIDFVYYVLVVLSFLILFFQTYVILFIERTKNDPEAVRKYKKCCLESFNSVLFMGIILVLLAIMTYDFFH